MTERKTAVSMLSLQSYVPRWCLLCVSNCFFHPSTSSKLLIVQHTQCPCRFVILATKNKKELCSHKLRDKTYIYSEYSANAVRHEVHTLYIHTCGVWVVFLEHGGGALGIFKSPVCTYNQSWTFARFTLFFLPPKASVAGGVCRPRSEAPSIFVRVCCL